MTKKTRRPVYMHEPGKLHDKFCEVCCHKKKGLLEELYIANVETKALVKQFSTEAWGKFTEPQLKAHARATGAENARNSNWRGALEMLHQKALERFESGEIKPEMKDFMDIQKLRVAEERAEKETKQPQKIVLVGVPLPGMPIDAANANVLPDSIVRPELIEAPKFDEDPEE